MFRGLSAAVRRAGPVRGSTGAVATDASAAAQAPLAPSALQAEQWIETALDTSAGEPVFSPPLTIDELEENRNMVLDALAPAQPVLDADDAGAGAITEGCSGEGAAAVAAVDPDKQMQAIEAEAAVRQNANDVFHLAVSLAMNPNIQRSVLRELQSDERLRATFTQYFANRGIALSFSEPLALPASSPGGGRDGAGAGGAPGAGAVEGSAKEEFLEALRERLEGVKDKLGDLGRGVWEAVAGYVCRVRNTLLGLFARQGKVRHAEAGAEGINVLDAVMSLASLLLLVVIVKRTR